MKEFNNLIGHVIAFDFEFGTITIDKTTLVIDTPRLKERIMRSNVKVGDKVEYNFSRNTGELIYLRVLVDSHAEQTSMS